MLEIFSLFTLILYLGSVKPGLIETLVLVGLWGVISLPGAWVIFRLAPPLVPTPHRTVRKMIELASLQPDLIVYDLGSGDGRILRAAAKHGARTTGYELSVLALLYTKIRSIGNKNVRVRFGNFWKRTFHDADVIFCYLMPDPMQRFQKEIWPQLKSGTKVVSHGFSIKELTPVKHEDGVFLYQKD